jgi:hypothetical protein
MEDLPWVDWMPTDPQRSLGRPPKDAAILYIFGYVPSQYLAPSCAAYCQAFHLVFPHVDPVCRIAPFGPRALLYVQSCIHDFSLSYQEATLSDNSPLYRTITPRPAQVFDTPVHRHYPQALRYTNDGMTANSLRELCKEED